MDRIGNEERCVESRYRTGVGEYSGPESIEMVWTRGENG